MLNLAQGTLQNALTWSPFHTASDILLAVLNNIEKEMNQRARFNVHLNWSRKQRSRCFITAQGWIKNNFYERQRVACVAEMASREHKTCFLDRWFISFYRVLSDLYNLSKCLEAGNWAISSATKIPGRSISSHIDLLCVPSRKALRFELLHYTRILAVLPQCWGRGLEVSRGLS